MLEITASFITNKNKKTTVEPRVTQTEERNVLQFELSGSMAKLNLLC